MSQQPPDPSDPLDALSDLLDGRGEGGEFEAFEALEALPGRSVADHLFVDALLKRYYCSDPHELRRRAHAILERIRVEEDGQDPGATLSRWVSIAAATLICVLYVLYLGREKPETLRAALGRVLAAAEHEHDLEYRIRMEPGFPGASEEEDALTLYVRGSDKLALRLRLRSMPQLREFFPDQEGLEFWVGTNGREFWFVPSMALMPVIVGESDRFLETVMRRQRLQLPMFQISRVLRQMQGEEYELEFLPLDPEAGRQSLDSIYVRAKPRLRGLARPDRIEIHAHRESGTVERLDLIWEEAPRGGTQRLVFELMDQQERGYDFYEHSAHHGPGRQVHRFQGR